MVARPVRIALRPLGTLALTLLVVVAITLAAGRALGALGPIALAALLALAAAARLAAVAITVALSSTAALSSSALAFTALTVITRV